MWRELLRILALPLARYVERHLICWLDIGGDAPPPPDYTPVAQANKEAAEISASVAREQLAEGRRQYDQNMAVAKPVVDAQLDIMRQTAQQGADYFNYAKTFRPLEQQLIQESAAGTEGANAAQRQQILDRGVADANALKARTNAFEVAQAGDIALATGGNRAIYDKFKDDIEADVGTAMADARVGQTSALATAARQAARYGVSVPADMTALTNQNAAKLAAAANNTRTAGVNSMRNVIANGIGLKRDAFVTGQAATTDAMNREGAALTTNRNMQIQDRSLDFARKLDVTGMARGLPGASTGAYSVATSAGTNAVGNQMAPGQALQGAVNASGATRMQGAQMAQQGALGVLNAQTSYANSVANSGTDMGSLLGGIGGVVTAFSDRRLKVNIEFLDVDPDTGINVYEFAYASDPSRRYVGVIAQEVLEVMPEAVHRSADGMLTVNYGMLGIEFKEIA